ncbi:hypothetical protein [Sphingobium chlorophenolicum]|uniref:hypothetical protein n=1 Tax=Sphingobium chlorophenolicum TaxID=46429 RepID=UPI00138E4C62|nr:hypothetical protein [Sphingobium chlorophenolicum]
MKQRAVPFDPQARLQSKDGICAYLGHISAATYDSWQAKGIVPGPIPGTNRYCIRQHDHVLDLRAGINVPSRAKPLSPLDEWEAAHAGAA